MSLPGRVGRHRVFPLSPSVCPSQNRDRSILKPTANWSPYIFTLVQKVKHRVYKIHVFEVKQYFAETLQVISFKNDAYFLHGRRERSGSVVKCLTRDRGAAGSSLTGVNALWSLSKKHLS